MGLVKTHPPYSRALRPLPQNRTSAAQAIKGSSPTAANSYGRLVGLTFTCVPICPCIAPGSTTQKLKTPDFP